MAFKENYYSRWERGVELSCSLCRSELMKLHLFKAWLKVWRSAVSMEWKGRRGKRMTDWQLNATYTNKWIPEHWRSCKIMATTGNLHLPFIPLTHTTAQHKFPVKRSVDSLSQPFKLWRNKRQKEIRLSDKADSWTWKQHNVIRTFSTRHRRATYGAPQQLE